SGPTPAGVPVAIRSPGSSVIACDTNATSAAMPNTMSRALPRCRSTLFTRQRTSSSERRAGSSGATRGPTGQNVSNPLARVHCSSLRCRSRAVTSFRQVIPATPPPPQGGAPVDPGRFRFIFPPVMKASDIRRGHVILIDGQPSRVMDFTHRTPGNLRAFVQLRLRNLVTGNTFDTRLAATEFVDEAPLETKEFQVLYADQGGVHVMDTTT